MKKILHICLVGVFVISFAGFALAESNQPTEVTAATATPEPHEVPMASPAPAPTTKPTTKKKHYRRHKHAAPAPTTAPEPTNAPE